jgi:hypothetical protein
MPLDLSKWGPLTVLIVGLALITAVGGLVVVIVAPDTLNFHQYLGDLKTLIVALAALAGAHGVLGAGQKVADAVTTHAITTTTGETTGLTGGAKAEGFEPPPEA